MFGAPNLSLPLRMVSGGTKFGQDEARATVFNLWGSINFGAMKYTLWHADEDDGARDPAKID